VIVPVNHFAVPGTRVISIFVLVITSTWPAHVLVIPVNHAAAPRAHIVFVVVFVDRLDRHDDDRTARVGPVLDALEDDLRVLEIADLLRQPDDLASDRPR
jgi:hypothetical protein